MFENKNSTTTWTTFLSDKLKRRFEFFFFFFQNGDCRNFQANEEIEKLRQKNLIMQSNNFSKFINEELSIFQ